MRCRSGASSAPTCTSQRDDWERHVSDARARRPTMEAYSGRQFVGIDLHRRRTVIVRTHAGW